MFTTIEQFEQAALMEVKIVTGRTHQIRVHAQYLGHCVAGDSNPSLNEVLRAVIEQVQPQLALAKVLGGEYRPESSQMSYVQVIPSKSQDQLHS